MTMIKEVLFNDGEGFDYVDFNNLQRFLGAELLDAVAESFAGKVEVTGLAANSACFALGRAAYPRPTGTTRQLTNFSGAIAQKVGTTDGSDPTFLVYYLAANDLQTTFASTPSTRCDIIQVKLDHVDGDSQTRDFEDATTHVVTSQTFNKQRQTRLTFSVKQGTDGTTTEPTPDAGYVKYCAVQLTSGMTTIPKTSIYDYRVPLGLRSDDVLGADGVYDASHWDNNNSGKQGGVAITADATGARNAWILCRSAAKGARLLGVGLLATIQTSSAATAKLVKYDVHNGTETVIADLTAYLINSVPAGASEYRELYLDGIVAATWLDGTPSGANLDSTAVPSGITKVGLKITSGAAQADVVHLVRFIFAGGM